MTQNDDGDRATMLEPLAICDLGKLPRLGVKGRDAERWLASEGVDVPANVFETRPWATGGLIARFGQHEFFLEAGTEDSSIESLLEHLAATENQAFAVEHQEAAFVLSGQRALEVLAQTCAINFREAENSHVVFTRVAGVNCCVLPRETPDGVAYRLWVDPSYAESLWETLVEICESLDGKVVEAPRVDSY